MKFSLLTLAASLGAVVAVNDCGDSTFVNQNSGGSPQAHVCQVCHLCRGCQPDIDVQAHCTIGCANMGHIGDEDAVDLINESIKRFPFDGRVGAKGVMGCSDSLNEQTDIEWGIYYT